MAAKPKNDSEKTNWKIPVLVAIIGAITTILVGWWQYGSKHPTDEKTRFVGRVKDSITEKYIRGAKVELEVEDVPPIIYTDSEGIFSFPLSKTIGLVHLRVQADGYENYDVRISPPANNEVKDIRLTPINRPTQRTQDQNARPSPATTDRRNVIVQEKPSPSQPQSANRVPALPAPSQETTSEARKARGCDLSTVKVVKSEGCAPSQCFESARSEVVRAALPGDIHEWSFGNRCLVCTCKAK